MKVDAKVIIRSLFLAGVWLLTFGGGILVGRYCCLPEDALPLALDDDKTKNAKDVNLLVEAPEVLVMGDVQNLPYQRKIWLLIEQLEAGDLYGKEREKALSLAQEYGAKCREAKVEPFGFLRIEELEKLHAVFNDLNLIRKLYPDISMRAAIMSTEQIKLNLYHTHLIIEYAEFMKKTDVGDPSDQADWAEFRERFASEEFGITHPISDLGLFNRIRERLNKECEK